MCGSTWPCVINILPLAAIGRTRCEKWPDSICDQCIESCLQAAKDEAARRAIP